MRDQGAGPPDSHGNEGLVYDRLIALFLFGAALFHPLMIDIFDRGPETLVLGLPVLYVYLFGAWAGVIVGLALIVERNSKARLRGEEAGRPRTPGP